MAKITATEGTTLHRQTPEYDRQSLIQLSGASHLTKASSDHSSPRKETEN
jgi:hypothetical protein